MVMGNTTMSPWRIGGKSLTNADRPVYSTDPLSDNISTIEIEHGTASGITVNSITLIVADNSDFSNPVSTIAGEFGANSTTTFSRPTDQDWSNMYYKILYNVTVSVNSNKYFQFIGATFYREDDSSGQETVATPTFSPFGGIYTESQSVTISCATDGADIYYTNDGTEPTESSTLYTSAIEVSETTTLKAKAFKTGSAPSGIATATYTFPELITIEAAHALANDAFAMVQGVVTFIDGRNVYAQDNTGGICLFLNNNTVPSTLGLGDMVQAYGQKTVYKGLIELQNIDGSNANEFSILSSGNELPLATKTIAEVLADNTNALQCTRVKIEEATIGAINTSGNTPLTQGESSINIYKVPALTDIEEGNVVDVIGVIGFYNNPQIRVAHAEDVALHETPVIPDPVLTVSVTELSDFQYMFGSGSSTPKSFTVAGTDLTANVTLTAPENYELSLNANTGYSNSIVLSLVNGNIEETTIYVRLAAGLEAGTYSGNVTIVSGDINKTVSLSGSVDVLPVAASPTFTPAAGTYLTAQNVTITSTTEGATIYYTLDGSDPTEESNVYSAPITVSETTTIKAFTGATGYDNSAIAEATYTINEVITIAEARTLDDNAYACVEGTVIFIDGRNVYIQDETAGIDLFLNNNTVPSTLAIGDKVRAYGKHAVYNGLVELSGINGGNANAFVILSTGNALPLTTRTIEAINNDFNGDNQLQATRVKIQDAIIGAININGNTTIVQGDNSLNIYRIPAIEGLVEGDRVTVIGIIGCYNAPQLRVVNASDVYFAHLPTLFANPTTVSGMTYDYEEGGPSEIQYFELSGDNLTGDINVTPSENFEVSSLPGDYFRPENPVVIYTHNLTNIDGVKVYVRMKAGLETGTYEEQITVTTDGANALYVSVSGTVTHDDPTPPTPPTEGNYVRISDLSSLTDGALVVFAARFDNNANDYYAMTATSSGKPAGVLFTSEASGSNEILPASITDEEASFYWTVGVTENGYTFTNAPGELIGYASSTNFLTGGDNTEWSIETGTAVETAMVPNYTGFNITNVNSNTRAFALNTSHNFGPYAKTNMSNNNAGNYNFFIDIFVKTEGGDTPTPVVATPTFTPAAGEYYEAQEVVINCTTEDATIYYTLDGTDPTTESSVYEEPISITETTTVKAMAVKEGYDNSAVAEAVYTITLIPAVTVDPLALTGFNYYEGDGPSDEQTFTVSASNLTEALTISETESFEISTLGGDDFVAESTITLTPENGSIEETTIYVRLKANLAIGEYEEAIVVATTGVDDIEITCSGSVVEMPVLGDDYVRISDAGELVAGNRIIFAARFNENVNEYYAMSNAATGKPTGVMFTSEVNGSDEIAPFDIISAEDNFYWTVGITEEGYTFTNAAGDTIGYTSGTNFAPNGNNTVWSIEVSTSAESAMVPNYTGFVISNVNNAVRAFALNASHNFGPYHTQNIAGDNYNFFLDIFMQGEGGTPSVAAPTFTPEAGTYYEAQEITISCTTEGATIYYSLESEEGPWMVYEGPIMLEEDATIWTYATMEDYNDSPVVSAEYVIQVGLTILFNQDWEEDWNGWTEVSVLGDTTVWSIAVHNGNHYAYLNAYNQGENEDWLISPAFDLDTYSNAVLTFVTARNYNGPEIEVYFSNDYDGADPTTATWELLECALSAGSWNWTESGTISLEGYSGNNCYIAFKYTSTEDAAAAWEIDDIMLVAGSEPITPTPTLTATPININDFEYMEEEGGPSDSQSYELTGNNLEGEGEVTVTVTEGFEISLDDEAYSDTLYIAFADGELVDQPVTIYVRLAEGLEAGTYEGTITHEGGNATVEVSLSGTVHSENEPMLAAFMPLYIQGNNGTNNNRVPVAIAAYILDLEPNTTYRYTNQFVTEDDDPTTAGAGNVIYTNEEGFYRSTSPSLATEGGYGEFTTDEDGLGFAWFINEPTANARFTPGNHVYLRIRLNDGQDGTTVAHTFTTEQYATVLNFGNDNDEYSGTAFYAKSNEAPMNFVMMFDTSDNERPVYSTSIETTGIDYGSINQYANFYKDEVAGNDGWFGGILPNNNEDGINMILVVDKDSYMVNTYSTENGQWYPEANTVNPNGGLDEPIFIDLTYDGVAEIEEANVKVWNTGHEFVIENGDNAHYMMTVYNILGQPMMTKQINAGSTERVSHSLANGIYVISLQNNPNKVSVKVIVR